VRGRTQVGPHSALWEVQDGVLGRLSAIRQLDYESANVAVNVRVARK